MNASDQVTTVELDQFNAEMSRLEAAQAAEVSAPAPEQRAAPTDDVQANNTDTRPPDKAEDQGSRIKDSDKKPESEILNPESEKAKPSDTKDGKAEAEKSVKEPSRYEKAQQRANEAWKKIEAEKAEIAKEREQLARQRQEVEAAKVPKYTPEQYQSAAEKFEAQAKQFEAEGKFEDAEEHRGLARLAKKQAEAIKANPPSAIAKDAKLEQEQGAWWQKAKAEIPELLDTQSPVNQQLRAFLQAEPSVLSHPKGPYFAAQLIRAQVAAGRVSGLETENTKLKARVQELEALTSPSGPGGPSHLPGPKSFEEMNADEQRSELMRLMNAN